jgi:tetratricopeptide (TPR) repeat protein
MQKAQLRYEFNFGEWVMTYPQEWRETRSMYYDALELENIHEEEAVKRYKLLLEKLPESDLDAYTAYGLLLKRTGKIKEGKALIRKAFELAQAAIPPSYYDNPGPISWGMIDNRPLLRALQFGAHEYEEEGKYAQAEKLFELILVANPMDNQGIRYMLPSLYIKQDKFEKFYDYCRDDDFDISGAFGLIIADFKTGKLQSAKKRVKAFKRLNPFLIKEILKKTHTPPDTPDYQMGYESEGSVEEAYRYYQEMAQYFAQNPEFITFLRECK